MSKEENVYKLLRILNDLNSTIRYFEYLNVLIKHFDFSKDDPRLAINTNVSAKRFSTNINHRLVLGLTLFEEEILFMFMMFEDDLDKFHEYEDIWYFSKKIDKAVIVFFTLEQIKDQEELILKSWIKCCEDFLPRGKRSPYRNSNVPLLFDMAVSNEVQREIFEKLDLKKTGYKRSKRKKRIENSEDDPLLNKELLVEIFDCFEEYIETEEALKHLEKMKSEKREVAQLMNRLMTMDRESEEFSELILFGLLPYANTKVAKRVSLFPAFMNIKMFFKEYNYSDKEWSLIANRIFDLCVNFKANPNKLSDYIQDFTKDKYANRLQCGSISPILFCLNDSFPIVNNRTIRSFRSLQMVIGNNEKLSQKLVDYLSNVDKINDLVKELNYPTIGNNAYQDLFFYWYDSELLSEDRREEKEEDEESENEFETEEEFQNEAIDFQEFIKEVNLPSSVDFVAHSLSDPQRIKINQIVSFCSDGRWVLPRFQRYFDWKKNDVKEFWESILNDYYVGSFLLWDSAKNPELGIQPILGVSKKNEDLRIDSIILDGQQRITSLYYAIRAPKFELLGSKVPLFFYINFFKFFENYKEDLVEFHATKLDREETFEQMLFPIHELNKYNHWVDDFEDYMLKKSPDLNKVRKIGRIIDRKLAHIWEGFEIPYISLPETMELFQVTDIFEKINTKGKPLSVFDLLIARLYKDNIELKKIWDATVKTYPNILRYFKTITKTPIYILQAMSILYEKSNSAKRADILDIFEKIYEKSERNFEEDWEDVSDYLNRAIEKLENMRDGFGVKDEKELPFAPMIPVLTALLKVIDSKENKADCYAKLNKWYWSAVFTNAYSSAADAQMTQDFKETRKWFDDDNEVPRVVLQITREIPNLYLREIQSKANSKYRGIMSLIALEGALDFDTSQALENARGNDKDHIFPKSFDFSHGSSKQSNSILNITWMSDSTNRKIKKCKKPSLYCQEFRAKIGNEQFRKILETHFINEVAYDYLIEDNFEEFLSERENAIIGKIRSIFEESDSNNKTLITPATPFSNKAVYIKLLNSCTKYIHWLDKYFSKKGLEWLVESVNRNVKEIRILRSTENLNEDFRKSFKDFRDEMLNRDVHCELKILTDPKIKASVHDRFLITQYNAYNIPSPDIIARGQLSEISKSENKEKLEFEFKELWNKSYDIINDWNEILKVLK